MIESLSEMTPSALALSNSFCMKKKEGRKCAKIAAMAAAAEAMS
jgi:hypothetical protein